MDSLTLQNSSSASGSDAFTLNIVNEDGEQRVMQVASLQFRWDYVLIYVLLRFLQGGGGGR